MAVLHQIWVKRAHRGKMDPAARATLVAGSGMTGNADQGGKRQLTLIDLDRWHELMDRFGADLETSARRANLVIDGLDLFDARGKTLRVGPTRLIIHGETRPCERMDEALPGLPEAMRERWGGGAFAEVIEGGEIVVGDEVEWVVALSSNS
jgi:MOSC domain-containing protein YiiM